MSPETSTITHSFGWKAILFCNECGVRMVIEIRHYDVDRSPDIVERSNFIDAIYKAAIARNRTQCTHLEALVPKSKQDIAYLLLDRDRARKDRIEANR